MSVRAQVKLLFQPVKDVSVFDVPVDFRDDMACVSIVRMLIPTVEQSNTHLSRLPLSVWFEVSKRVIHQSISGGQVLFRQGDPGVQ